MACLPHTVAICVNNPVEAVILDQEHFIQTEGWSVAQSLKLIRRNLCVVLVERGEKLLVPISPAGSMRWFQTMTQMLLATSQASAAKRVLGSKRIQAATV